MPGMDETAAARFEGLVFPRSADSDATDEDPAPPSYGVPTRITQVVGTLPTAR